MLVVVVSEGGACVLSGGVTYHEGRGQDEAKVEHLRSEVPRVLEGGQHCVGWLVSRGLGAVVFVVVEYIQVQQHSSNSFVAVQREGENAGVRE